MFSYVNRLNISNLSKNDRKILSLVVRPRCVINFVIAIAIAIIIAIAIAIIIIAAAAAAAQGECTHARVYTRVYTRL